jgi:hypothetical protein
MRCMACGGEMILMKVIQDVTQPIPGFERHAYMCSLCHDTEHRLVFNKQAKECDSEIGPATPVSTIQNLRTTAQLIQNLRTTAQFFFGPMLAKIPALLRRGGAVARDRSSDINP